MPAAVLGLAAIAMAGPLAAPPSAILLERAPGGGSKGKVFLNLDEALKLAFPKLEVRRSTAFLDKKQRAQIEKLAGAPLVSGIIYPYRAYERDPKTGKDVVVGTAYFETHRVRSLRETMMIVVSPDGQIQRAEILAFHEPLDYMPNRRFYAQFLGRGLDDGLRTKRGIKAVTGCTLTVNATTKAVRRILAIHQVLGEPAPPHAKSGAERSKR